MHVYVCAYSSVLQVRNVLRASVLRVYTWNSRAIDKNRVGTGYIIMEKISGIPLGKVWDWLPLKHRAEVDIHADYRVSEEVVHREILSTRKSTMLKILSLPQLKTTYLYVDQDGSEVCDSRSAVGSAVGREWVDDGRQKWKMQI